MAVEGSLRQLMTMLSCSVAFMQEFEWQVYAAVIW